MDVPILSIFLRSMFTAATVWNTGETGDIDWAIIDHIAGGQNI